MIVTPLVFAAGVALYETNEPFREFCDETYTKFKDFAGRHGIHDPWAERRAREEPYGAEGSQSTHREWVPLRRRQGWGPLGDSGSEPDRPIKKEETEVKGLFPEAESSGLDASRASLRRRAGPDADSATPPVNPLAMNPAHDSAAAAAGRRSQQSVTPLSVEAMGAHNQANRSFDQESTSDFSTRGIPTPTTSEPSDAASRHSFAHVDQRDVDAQSNSTETASRPASRLSRDTVDVQDVHHREEDAPWEHDDAVSLASSWSEVGSEVSLESHRDRRGL